MTRLLAITFGAVLLGAACLDFPGADQRCHASGRCSSDGGLGGGFMAAGGGTGGGSVATGGGAAGGSVTGGGSGGSGGGSSVGGGTAGAGGTGGGATGGGTGGAGGSGGGAAGGTSYTLAVIEPQPVTFPSGSCGPVTVELRQGANPVTGVAGTVVFTAPVASVATTCAAGAATTASVPIDMLNGRAAVAVSGAWFGPMTLTASSSIATGASAQISFVGKPELTLGPASPIPPNQCTLGTLGVVRSVGLGPATAIGDGGTIRLSSSTMTFFASMAGVCVPPAVTQLFIGNTRSNIGFSFNTNTTGTVSLSGGYVSNLDVPYTVSCNAANCTGCCNGTTCNTAPNPSQCGAGGMMCQACNLVATNMCSNGMCTCNGAAPCASGTACSAVGCTPKWTQVPKQATWPPARMLHSMAWDPVSGQVVLFGGSSSPDAGRMTALGDTWTWDGMQWQSQGLGGPSDRYGAALSRSDTNGGQLVMTGGTDGTTLYSDSLRYAGGSNWNGTGGSRPYARYGHVQAMHWAKATNNGVVLFGGYGGLLPYRVLDDIWEYDNSWNGPMMPSGSPLERMYAAAAPLGDAQMPFLAGLVVTGGLDMSGQPLNDTHIYGSSFWFNGPMLPTPLFGHSMATDDAGVNATWIFGGFTRVTPPALTNTLLLWDGNAWQPQTVYGSPPARAFSQMTYDATHRKLVLFGGTDGTNTLDDLWELQR